MPKYLFPSSLIRMMRNRSKGTNPHRVQCFCIRVIYRGDEENIEDTIRSMMARPYPPDALFCHNDVIARQVYTVAEEMDLRISVDIGVIGFDNNLPICLSLTPKLSSISFQGYEIGHQAAVLLHSMEFEKEADYQNVYLLQPSLVLRESCQGPEG